MQNIDKNPREALMTAVESGDASAIATATADYMAAMETRIEDRVAAYASRARQGGVTGYAKFLAYNLDTPDADKSDKYFKAVVEKHGFDGVSELFPKTVMDYVYSRLKTEHPLLSLVDVRNVRGVLTMLYAKDNTATAFWGPICEEIKQMVLSGFEEVRLDNSKLSGFVPVCKALLELGPEWLAQYVADVMYEIMATSLEAAIIAGDGKNKPIGMIKKLTGAVDGVYQDRETVAITKFDAASLAGVRASLAAENPNARDVRMIVNPQTYWLKVFPALAYRAADGAWITDRLPTGEQIILSRAVPLDRIIVGDPKDYILGIASDITISRYDQTLAIEDQELFIARFLGMGRPKHYNAFFVLDVAGVAGGTAAPVDKPKAK